MDRVTLIQIQCASSILKALFIQRFMLEGECWNQSQINQQLMIVIRNFANLQSLPQDLVIILLSPAVDLQSTPASTISSCGCSLPCVVEVLPTTVTVNLLQLTTFSCLFAT